MSMWAVYVRQIILLMGRYSKRVPLLLVFGVILGAIDILGLGLVAQFLGAVLGGSINPVSNMFVNGLELVPVEVIGVSLIFVFSLRACLGAYSYWYINNISGKVEAALKARLLLHYQRMPYERRIARGESDLLNAINLWTTQYVRFVLVPLARLVSELLISLMVFIFLAKISFIFLVSFCTLIGFVALAYDLALKRRGQAYAKIFRRLSTQVVADVQQGLEGFKEIRAFRLERYFQQRIFASAKEMCSALAKANTISQSPRLIIEAVVVSFVVASLFMTQNMSARATDALPVLAMFAVAGMRVVSLASLASSIVFNLRLYRPVVAQLVEDHTVAVSENEINDGRSLGDFKVLEVVNLGFTYLNAAKPALQGISFSCESGEHLVIVGPSGSGKTTLIDLLLGILKPTSGNINVLCSESAQPTFVGLASYLSQNTFILNDSLRRNVALGLTDEEIDDARVISALLKAKLPQFANAEFLDLSLGDRGCRISGGQRQRVALARAFYLGRNVLILDEATNALDLETETEIVKDLLDLRNEITLIAITHRPEIAKLFARKLSLVDGTSSQL